MRIQTGYQAFLVTSCILLSPYCGPLLSGQDQRKVDTLEIVQEIKSSVEESRSAITRLMVKYSETSAAPDSLIEQGDLNHVGKDSEVTFAFSGTKRYLDFYGTGFKRDMAPQNYLAVFDGELMHKREGKFVEISSVKSSLTESSMFMASIMWPIADHDSQSLENGPSSFHFLPKILDKAWEVISDRQQTNLVALRNPETKIELVFDSEKDFALVEVVYPTEFVDDVGFGKTISRYGDYRKIGPCWFPFLIETSTEVFKYQTKVVAGTVRSKLVVEELKVNEDVPESIFYLTPGPGEVVHDRTTGLVTSPATLSRSSIESVVSELDMQSNPGQSFPWQPSVVAAVLGVGLGLVARRYFRTTSTFKSLAVALVAGSMFFSSPQEQSRAQESSETMVRRVYYQYVNCLEFWVKKDGHLAFRMTQAPRYITPLPLLSCIENQEAFQQLEIVDFQHLDVADSIAAIKSAVDAFELKRKETGATPQFEQKIFQKPVKDAEAILSSVLLPHQTCRLREIVAQCEICRTGLASSFKFGSLKSVEMSDKDWKVVSTVFLQNYRDILPEITRQKERLTSKIRNVLNRKQTSQIDQLLDELPELPLIAHLAISDPDYVKFVDAMFDAELDVNLRPLRGFLFSKRFGIRANGEVFVPAVLAEIKNLKETIHLSLLRLLDSPKGRIHFELTDNQAAAFHQLGIDWLRLKDEWRVSAENFMDHEAYREHWYKKFMDARNLHFRIIFESLNDTQIDKLQHLVQKAEITCIGLLNSLISGSTGKKLGISEAQRESLKEVQKQYFEETKKRLIEIEVSIEDKMIRSMGQHNETQWKRSSAKGSQG